MSISFLNRYPSIVELFFIFLVSFMLRAFIFHAFLMHNERFCQSDSLDYHMSAVCIQHGNGMTRLDNQKPIYWRTPGYPLFLAACYSSIGQKIDLKFDAYEVQHLFALWVQLFLSALIPLLVFFLGYIITGSYAVARLSAYVTMVHLGFVLSSGYLLTDSLAALFFIIFMIFFYQSLYTPGYQFVSANCALILAAINLAVYTWMRPMGQFISLIATGMLLLGNRRFKESMFKAFIFLALFFLLLLPWFWRNYQLTGLFFFCPLFGLYFNVFNAPRIIAYVSGIPLEVVHKQFTLAGGYAQAYEMLRYSLNNTSYQVCGEYVCLFTAWPVIMAHPILFIIDWLREVCKTTFDLFSYQLVAFHKECFKWDPMVEFLSDKVATCLFGDIPLVLRIISCGELLFYIVLWSSIFAGLYKYLIMPFVKREHLSRKSYIWFQSALLVISVVGQTGGFGYARLRLAIEPLLIIGGIWFWWECFTERLMPNK